MKAQSEKASSPLRLKAKPADLLLPKQEAALAALLSHPTLKEAAMACGVSEVTLWRYLRDDKFISRYQAARREATGHAVMRLQHHASDAARVLCQIADDTNAPASARIAAARTILDRSLRAVEIGDLMVRIEQLEAYIERVLEQRLLDEGARAMEEAE